MRRTKVLFLLLGVAMWVSAQTPVSRWNGYGYYSYGVLKGEDVDDSQPLGVGGGVEAFVLRRLALGADIGYQAKRDFGYNPAMGVFDAGVRYHFIDPGKRKPLDPFVTFGGGFGFDKGYGDPGELISAGGGVNWWFKPRIGLRAEVKANIFTSAVMGQVVTRVGLVFR